jgi:hypothetical protein
MRTGDLINALAGWENVEVEAVMQPHYPMVAPILEVMVDPDDDKVYIVLGDHYRMYDEDSDD